MLQSGVPHIDLASFVSGTNCAPFHFPAILPSTSSILCSVGRYVHPFSSPGVASMPVMWLSFGILGPDEARVVGWRSGWVLDVAKLQEWAALARLATSCFSDG